MDSLYFEINDFEKLTDFLDQYDWENNKAEIRIQKEKTHWTVCLTDVAE
jgi:hypothetical protein